MDHHILCNQFSNYILHRNPNHIRLSHCVSIPNPDTYADILSNRFCDCVCVPDQHVNPVADCITVGHVNADCQHNIHLDPHLHAQFAGFPNIISDRAWKCVFNSHGSDYPFFVCHSFLHSRLKLIRVPIPCPLHVPQPVPIPCPLYIPWHHWQPHFNLLCVVRRTCDLITNIISSICFYLHSHFDAFATPFCPGICNPNSDRILIYNPHGLLFFVGNSITPHNWKFNIIKNCFPDLLLDHHILCNQFSNYILHRNPNHIRLSHCVSIPNPDTYADILSNRFCDCVCVPDQHVNPVAD